MVDTNNVQRCLSEMSIKPQKQANARMEIIFKSTERNATSAAERWKGKTEGQLPVRNL